MSSVDFPDQLRRQLLFLENSCNLFDQGCLEEAIRIATTLRVLFHATRSSTSLLTHLQGESCSLLSTAMAIPGRRDGFALVAIRFVAKPYPTPVRASPKLAGAPHQRFIPFDEWWTHEGIINAGVASGATRRNLVLWAANNDGGAHVDDQLEPRYEAVIAGLGMAVRLVETDEGRIPEAERVAMPVQDLHFATLRQIAHEVLGSPDVLALLNQTGP